MFPIIPLLAAVLIGGGGATLYWYETLSHEEKKRANRLTADYALSLFGKTVDQLTAAEAEDVHNRVKAYFS